jgi:hypothetical protein
MIISDLNYLEVVQTENIVGGIADIDNYTNLEFYEVVDVYKEFDVKADVALALLQKLMQLPTVKMLTPKHSASPTPTTVSLPLVLPLFQSQVNPNYLKNQ